MENSTMLSNIFMILLILISAGQVFSQRNQCGDARQFPLLDCKIETLNLIEENNPIQIKIYTKAHPNYQNDRTFVVVHGNEEKGLSAVKEVLSESDFGGRLVEITSNYKKSYKDRGYFIETSNEGRYLHFGNGKFCVDPNRIYSTVNRDIALKDGKKKCPQTPTDNNEIIKKLGEFATALIDIVTNKKNGTHKFIIGVHNNTKDDNAGLDIRSWLSGGAEAKTGVGIVGTNYHSGSKKGLTRDDFILVSNSILFKAFFDVNNPFDINIALQEEKKYLTDSNGNIKEDFDDGSMSIYFGSNNFEGDIPYFYINIEAGGKPNKHYNDDSSKKWQMEMIKKAIGIKI